MPPKQGMVGVCKVDKKHEIFDFETIVHQLFINRLDSRAGKLLYSRVLQENSKKSGQKYFFVEITSKTQNSQMALENSTYVDFSGGVIFFGKIDVESTSDNEFLIFRLFSRELTSTTTCELLSTKG